MLGLICAIPQEIEHFGKGFIEERSLTLAGTAFRQGRLDGHQVVLVEAGIGKVNNALAATLLCHEFHCRAVLFSGVAGGLDPTLGIGDVVIGTLLIQHDYGALINGQITPYQPGVPPLAGFDRNIGYGLDKALVKRLTEALDDVSLPPMPATATGGRARIPVIRFGTIVTGDTFVQCDATRQRLHQSFGGLAVEMEGAAVAQVTEKYGVPAIVVRCLSDLAGAESHMDFPSFAKAAGGAAAGLLRRIIAVV